eukprot:11224759-Lingulodinium_polyedra.AAC.1
MTSRASRMGRHDGSVEEVPDGVVERAVRQPQALQVGRCARGARPHPGRAVGSRAGRRAARSKLRLPAMASSLR